MSKKTPEWTAEAERDDVTRRTYYRRCHGCGWQPESEFGDLPPVECRPRCRTCKAG